MNSPSFSIFVCPATELYQSCIIHRAKHNIHRSVSSVHPSICGNLIECPVRTLLSLSSLAGWLARNPNKAGGEMFKRHFIFPIGRSSVSQSPSLPRSHLSRPIYQTTTRISLLRRERFKSRAPCPFNWEFVILPPKLKCISCSTNVRSTTGIG